MEKFNHHMMTLARDSRGLTQAELAVRLGIMQGTLSKYETGFQEPPPEFVGELSEALNYPRLFFYEVGRPYGLPPFHYRRRKKLSAKALGRIVAEMNIRRIHLTKLLVSFEWKTNAFIPEIDQDEYRGRSKGVLSIEDVARAVREMWMLPKGPISNVVELIESNGGIVIPCDFGTDLIDAMSQRIEGLPVLFFVNVNAPADRLRHTLSHEIGHIALRYSVSIRTWAQTKPIRHIVLTVTWIESARRAAPAGARARHRGLSLTASPSQRVPCRRGRRQRQRVSSLWPRRPLGAPPASSPTGPAGFFIQAGIRPWRTTYENSEHVLSSIPISYAK